MNRLSFLPFLSFSVLLLAGPSWAQTMAKTAPPVAQEAVPQRDINDTSYLNQSLIFEEALPEFEKSHNRMPKLTDKTQEGLVLARLINQRSYIDPVEFIPNNIEGIFLLCNQANSMSTFYTTFRLETKIDFDHLDQRDAEQTMQTYQELMRQNTITYLPELSGLQPFAIACIGKQAELLTWQLEKADEPTRETIKAKKEQMLNQLNDQMGLLGDPQLPSSYHVAILTALAKIAKPYAAMLSIAERSELMKLAQTVLDNPNIVEEMKKPMRAIHQAMQRKTCDGLCAL